MASRMEKYYNNNSRTNTRSSKNENLYRDIYEKTEYSNIEGIKALDKTNEINLEQIKELLKEREERQKKPTPKPIEPKEIEKPIYEEKNYDIRDVLSKAKDEHEEDDKALRNTKYNILKELTMKEDKEEETDLEKTLANTNILKNLDDNELSLDMLDLKSTGNTLVTENVGNLLKEVQEAKDNYEPEEDDGLDRSFYTSSLNFKEDDFEQLKDIQDSIESNNKQIKALFIILFLVIIGILGFILYKLL